MAWANSHSHGFPTTTRRRILQRDRTCRCTGCPHHHGTCTAAATEADHITPVHLGGTDDEANGQGLCTPCHQAKTTREALEQRARRSRRRPPAPHPGLTGGG